MLKYSRSPEELQQYVKLSEISFQTQAGMDKTSQACLYYCSKQALASVNLYTTQ